MQYISTAETARKWDVSERTVRNDCAAGKIPDAVLVKNIWQIPAQAKRPESSSGQRKKPKESALLHVLRQEKASKLSGGIYHKMQIEMTYNSNPMEGSWLTEDQTRYIFETNSIGIENAVVNTDDIIETAAHFKCIDLVIDDAQKPRSERWIKRLHEILKNGTSDSRKDWFAVGGLKTTNPENATKEMRALLKEYNEKREKTLGDILAFHVRFERIHPFQDGNGRIGRLILLKECLRNNIVPFIITEDLKLFYSRGLREWDREHGFWRDTCLSAQDQFKTYLDYFQIPYQE